MTGIHQWGEGLDVIYLLLSLGFVVDSFSFMGAPVMVVFLPVSFFNEKGVEQK